ncbi:MAG: LPXTG cell wall anchor domain-containing protein [Sulfolobus sp.]
MPKTFYTTSNKYVLLKTDNMRKCYIFVIILLLIIPHTYLANTKQTEEVITLPTITLNVKISQQYIDNPLYINFSITPTNLQLEISGNQSPITVISPINYTPFSNSNYVMISFPQQEIINWLAENMSLKILIISTYQNATITLSYVEITRISDNEANFNNTYITNLTTTNNSSNNNLTLFIIIMVLGISLFLILRRIKNR